MKKQKLMAILSAAALSVGLSGFAGISAGAQEGDTKKGNCGENAAYTLDSAGTLTISGSGTEAVKQNYGGNLIWTEQSDIIIQPELTDTEYAVGSSEGATIKCSGELKDFLSVEVDNKVVDASHYTLKEGSTILTFLPKYLDTLSVGEHQIKLNYTNNRAVNTRLVVQNTKETTTAAKEETTVSKQPDTGDVSMPFLWFLIAVLAAGACFSILVKKHSMKQ